MSNSRSSLRLPLVLLALGLASATFSGCAPHPEAAQVVTASPGLAVPVTTAPVLAASAFEDVAVSGLLASETEARLSFKTGGIIQRMAVKEGDRVVAGQLLAALNLTEIHAQVDQANEGLLKAGRDLDRVKALFATSVATQEQFDNAQTAYQVALRTREIATYNLGFSEIRASGPGVVVKKLMNEGELASPGSPVFLISGSAAVDWVLRCLISDVQWAKARVGDRAVLTLDAYPGTSWPAVLSRRSSAAEPGTGLYQVDIQVLPGPQPLATGLFGKGHLRVSAPAGQFEVPTQSLLSMVGNRGNVVVATEGRMEPRTVSVVRWGRDTVVVQGALSIGERVVDRGAAYLALAPAKEPHP